MSRRLTAIATDDLEARSKISRLNSAIFALVCFIPVFATVVFGAVDNITWTLLAISVVLLVGMWLIDAFGSESIRIATDSIQLPLLGLILLGLIHLLPLGADTASGLLSVQGRRTLSIDPYSTAFFVRNLLVFLLFLTAALTFLNSEPRLRKVSVLITIFGGIMAFLAILQRIAYSDAIYGLRVPFQASPFGPFVNGHHFAGFMEMTAGVTLGLILGEMPRQKKVLFALSLIIMIAAILMTSSRGGMISLLVTAAMATTLSFLSRKRRHSESDGKFTIRTPVLIGSAGIGVIAIVLVLLLGADESLSRGLGLTEVGGGGDASNGRLHFWSIAWQIFLDHPIVGSGFESYGVAFTRYDTWNGIFRVERAHNDYLQILAEGGILGIACVGAFLYWFFRKGLVSVAHAGIGFRRDVAVGAIAGCTGILVHSFVDFPLRTWSNSFFFLLLVALAIVKVAPNASKRSSRRSSSTT